MHRIAPILVLVFATAAAAQQQQPAGTWRAVDQAVADLDPLARSMRQIETGLRRIGEQRSLFEYHAAGQSLHFTGERRYVRLGDGFRANVPRLDYLIPISRRDAAMNIAPLRDGVFIELGPPDMVFELDPMSINNTSAPPAARVNPTPAGPGPLDLRVDVRIDGRIEAFIEPVMVTSPHLQPASP